MLSLLADPSDLVEEPGIDARSIGHRVDACASPQKALDLKDAIRGRHPDRLQELRVVETVECRFCRIGVEAETARFERTQGLLQ